MSDLEKRVEALREKIAVLVQIAIVGYKIDGKQSDHAEMFADRIWSLITRPESRALLAPREEWWCRGCGKVMDSAYSEAYRSGESRHNVSADASHPGGWCGPIEKRSREEEPGLREVLTEVDETLTEMGWHTDRGLLMRVRAALAARPVEAKGEVGLRDLGTAPWICDTCGREWSGSYGDHIGALSEHPSKNTDEDGRLIATHQCRGKVRRVDRRSRPAPADAPEAER